MSRKHHSSKRGKQVLRELEAQGYRITPTAKGYKITAPKGHPNSNPYFYHGTDLGVKPLIREMKRDYGAKLTKS